MTVYWVKTTIFFLNVFPLNINPSTPKYTIALNVIILVCFSITIFLMQMQVWSSLAGYLQHNECLDTHHTHSLMHTTLYSLLYTVLYTVLYNNQHLEVQVAALKDLFPRNTSPPAYILYIFYTVLKYIKYTVFFQQIVQCTVFFKLYIKLYSIYIQSVHFSIYSNVHCTVYTFV